jgi:UDP-N-acetylglucosamine:LPS N-acetylglucosamine transferase
VRPEIQPLNAGECRLALGLEPDRPTLLVTGGSQGARAINELVVSALEVFARELPTLQFLHLTGFHNSEGVAAAYRGAGARARVTPFMEDMARALGAADVAVGRAGASSIVECLLTDHMLRQRMRAALASWHRPGAAEEIASVILESLATGEVPIPARSCRGGMERVPRRGLPGAGDVSRRSVAGMGTSGIGGV